MKDRVIYAPGTVHYKRLKTDAQFIADDLIARYTGVIEQTARFAVDAQCMDPARWARFADQFRLRTDGQDNAWRGEYWGKAMRGAAFLYAHTRDGALYSVLCDTVEDLLSTADGTGAIASYPPEAEFGGWDIWCRKYVLLGLQYFAEICEEKDLKAQCIASMERQAQYIIAHIGEGEGKIPITEATPNWRGLAASSILEPMVRLFDITGNFDYLEFAAYIVSCGGTSIANLFGLAYEGITDPYLFPITKAYEMISCFEGLLEFYRATGMEEIKTMVLNFASRAAAGEITIVGSAGCTHELFDHAAWRQTDSSLTDVMQETCVTVTWMKFCLQLLCLTGDAAWADRLEQSLYNAYLGAVNTEKRESRKVLLELPELAGFPLPFDSYSPLRPDARGRQIGGLMRMDGNSYYGCCAAIGGAGIGIVHKAAVTLAPHGVAVNLFIPGTVQVHTPENRELTIKIETLYPASGDIRISVFPTYSETFDLLLRIPAWSAQTALYLNGQPLPVTPGGYARICRCWNPGDAMLLRLDMRTRILRPTPWKRDIVITDYKWRHHYMVPRVITAPADLMQYYALQRGPLVLARERRLGESPDEPTAPVCDADGYAVSEPVARVPIPYQTARRFRTKDGGSFLAVDYASAGKTLDDTSRCACWLPLREE